MKSFSRYEVDAFHDVGTIASELVRIRKLLDKLVTHLTEGPPDAQPQAQDVDL